MSGNTIAAKNDTVDLSRIRQPKVRTFLQEQQLVTTADFAKLKSFSISNPAMADFSHHIKKFVVAADIEKVWHTYKHIHPKYAWNGNIVTFGLQYSKPKNALTYIDDVYEGIEVGQIIFINVAFFGGLVNIAVGHEVTDVNEADKSFRTCYLLSGKAAGTQQISLKKTADGFTEITHHTIYRSDSKFRDNVLYPFLHTQAITEFHGNIKAQVVKR